MNQKIALLKSAVIDRIKAGEVIEGSASVVKELVDNAIDASASHISIDMINGGRDLILVTDNGCGMNPSDAKLSFERHATSKLVSDEDFSSLTTLGFRGEALASICAVSKIKMVTAEEGKKGTLIEAASGTIERIETVEAPCGTRVEVSSLFYSVPVRRKFLGAPQSDVKAVKQIVVQFAIAYPSIHFRLVHNSELLFDSVPSGQKEKIEEVLGSDWCKRGKWVFFSKEGVQIEGVIALPSDEKGQRMHQMVFVNKRPIFSPMVSKAVQAGYSTAISEKKYPPFVLLMTLDPSLIDVNVHPQKKEVRFCRELQLFSLIEEAVSSTLFLKKEEKKIIPPFFQEPFLSVEQDLKDVVFKPFAAPKEKELSFEMPKKGPELLTTFPGAFMAKNLGEEQEGVWIVDHKAASSLLAFEELKKRGEKDPQKLLAYAKSQSLSTQEKLGSLEAKWLLEKIAPYIATKVCPLGNPIWTFLSLKEMTRDVSRKN